MDPELVPGMYAQAQNGWHPQVLLLHYQAHGTGVSFDQFQRIVLIGLPPAFSQPVCDLWNVICGM